MLLIENLTMSMFIQMLKFEHVLPKIIKKLKSTYGHEFFNEITLQLNNITGADYTFIAKVDYESFTSKTISLVVKNKLADNIEYNLTDTPCAILTKNKISIYPKEICSFFPKDQLLIDMNIEGYVGVPLHDSKGGVIGIIVALHEKEIRNADFIETLFELFSGRIAAEIERNVQNNELKQLNEKLADKVDELTASESKLSLHIKNTPLGCITWDRNLRCVEWNKAAEKIFGYTQNEAIGKHAFELIVLNDLREYTITIFNALLNKTGDVQNSNKNRTKDGKTIMCDWYDTPIVSEDDSVSGITSLIQDTTERDKKEALLRRSQKMDALGMLTSGIAHDQNNILGIIVGYSDLLNLKLKEQPKLLNYVAQIQNASKRSALLIEKLLSYSKSKSLFSSKLNINNFLLEQRDMLQKTITVQIKLNLKLGDKIWSVWLDKNDLEDAVINLIINSMHAMNSKTSMPQITVSSKNVKLNNLIAGAKGICAGEYVMLCIADNGSGMDSETKEKIFDPFFTTKGDKGTGLGLSQVFSFVNNSSGSIHIESRVNYGTEFTLYFPRYQQQQSKITLVDEVQHTSAEGLETILVVDDETSLCELASEFLSLAGYKVLCANGHKKALEILKNHHVDLMLSDVVMPEMNGYQLSSLVKQKYPLIKIQLVSGHVDSTNTIVIDKYLQKGLIKKPYDYQILKNRIRDLLNNKT
jgi:PAS domain S-box-containing protein